MGHNPVGLAHANDRQRLRWDKFDKWSKSTVARLSESASDGGEEGLYERQKESSLKYT